MIVYIVSVVFCVIGFALLFCGIDGAGLALTLLGIFGVYAIGDAKMRSGEW